MNITETLQAFAKELQEDLDITKEMGGMFDPTYKDVEVIGVRTIVRLSNGVEFAMQSDQRKNDGRYTSVARGHLSAGRVMDDPTTF